MVCSHIAAGSWLLDLFSPTGDMFVNLDMYEGSFDVLFQKFVNSVS